MIVKVRNGVFEDKDNLVIDVSKAFKEGLGNDITFVLADDVSISTNKFMLACRVPYFSKMLFGGFADNLTDKPVPLSCCTSSTFREILNYVWEAKVSFSDMSMQALLDLLEVSRFFCIESLVEAIIDHFEFLLDRKEINVKDCLAAFQFTEAHKFKGTSELFLDFIDQNLSSIYTLEVFGDLSETSMRKLLEYEKRNSTEIERFTAFTRWLDSKETRPLFEKSEILNWFDLRKFNKEALKHARKSGLFDEEDICEILEERIDILEEKLEAREQLISECEIVKFSMTGSANTQFNQRIRYVIPTEFHAHFLNKAWFSLGLASRKYSYTFECSEDGQTWTELLQRHNVFGGHQSISFERRKMKYIGVKMSTPTDFPPRDLTAEMI